MHVHKKNPVNQTIGEVLLMSTHNICFHGEIRKMLKLFGWKKKGSYLMLYECASFAQENKKIKNLQ